MPVDFCTFALAIENFIYLSITRILVSDRDVLYHYTNLSFDTKIPCKIVKMLSFSDNI